MVREVEREPRLQAHVRQHLQGPGHAGGAVDLCYEVANGALALASEATHGATELRDHPQDLGVQLQQVLLDRLLVPDEAHQWLQVLVVFGHGEGVQVGHLHGHVASAVFIVDHFSVTISWASRLSVAVLLSARHVAWTCVLIRGAPRKRCSCSRNF